MPESIKNTIVDGGQKKKKKKDPEKDKSKDIPKQKQKQKQLFLGQGAYGCAWYPGISCSGKINTRNTVNKIQKVNFYSKNELENYNVIKQIKNYKNRFAYLKDSCIVNYDVINNNKNMDHTKCSNLFEGRYDDTMYNMYNGDGQGDYGIKYVNEKFFLFFINYIKGYSLKKYFLFFENDLHKYIIKYTSSLCYLFRSIDLMRRHKFVHNDLHTSNILYDTKNDRPCIIDFGLSYKIKNFFKFNGDINFSFLNKFYFSYENDIYHRLVEERFINYCIEVGNIYENVYDNFFSNNIKNTLTSSLIDNFISDSINSIMYNREMNYIFTKLELDYYKLELEKYYKKFLNTNKYKYYSDIIKELLDSCFKFTDCFSVVIGYIHINYLILYENKEHSNIIENNDYLFISNLFVQMLKKVIHPDPAIRLTNSQFIKIIQFIILYCKDNSFDNSFDLKFKKLLSEIHIPYDIFFDKKYAFIDFTLILNKKNIAIINRLNITV
jgi:hypothetical protein